MPASRRATFTNPTSVWGAAEILNLDGGQSLRISYGLPWYRTSDYANLGALWAAAGAGPYNVVVNSNIAVTANLTFAAGIHLVVQPDFLITVNNGVTFTIYSPEHVHAGPRQQLFTLAGTGAVGWTSGGRIAASWFASFANAVASAGVGDHTILIATGQTIAANLTLLANINLDFARPGAWLQVNNGITLTINSPEHIRANPRGRIFNLVGTGLVAFTVGGTVYPGWWGAVADGATDSAAAIQTAINSIAALGGAVILPAGRTMINAKLTIDSPILFVGSGCGEKDDATIGTFLVKGADTNGIDVTQGACLRDFCLDSDGHDGGKVGITVDVTDSAYYVSMANVRIINQSSHGFVFVTTNEGKYYNLQARHNGGDGFHFAGTVAVNCNANLLSACSAFDNDGIGFDIASNANENVLLCCVSQSNNGASDGFYVNTYGNALLLCYAEGNGGEQVHLGAAAKANFVIGVIPPTVINDGSDGNFILDRGPAASDLLWLNRLRMIGDVTLTGNLLGAAGSYAQLNDVRFTDANHSPGVKGQMMFDNFLTGVANGILEWHDGTALRFLVDSGSYQSGAGSPVAAKTPAFVGQEYLDTTGHIWWKAYGLNNTNWNQLG
jgi:hypothetical protein